VPVFLRWLLVDIIVMRILRHRRIRPYVDRAYPMVTRYGSRFGRRMYPTAAGRYRFMRRRPRLSCCSGCFALSAAIILGLFLLVELVRWAL